VKHRVERGRSNGAIGEIENELLPLCEDQGVGVIAYNPLAGGFLTGKHRRDLPPADNTRFAVAGKLYVDRYWNDASFSVVERLQDFLATRGKSLTHVALAWVLMQRAVTAAIVGATSPEQLRDALQGVGLELDREEMDQCNEVWYDVPRARDPRIALR
jgi:aryl-alcohol dehydrogenase-like predicted oxidoreductase